MDKFYFYMWEEVEEAVNTIVTELESLSHLKYIYGIPRGGVTLASMISYRTELEYLDRLDKHGEETEHQTLLVDDICDTGNTFFHLTREKAYRTASMVNKTNPIFTPNIFVYEKKSEWEIFPWEDGDSERLDFLNK
jgi:hypoxanthine phosphoribosyltransferase